MSDGFRIFVDTHDAPGRKAAVQQAKQPPRRTLLTKELLVLQRGKRADENDFVLPKLRFDPTLEFDPPGLHGNVARRICFGNLDEMKASEKSATMLAPAGSHVNSSSGLPSAQEEKHQAHKGGDGPEQQDRHPIGLHGFKASGKQEQLELARRALLKAIGNAKNPRALPLQKNRDPEVLEHVPKNHGNANGGITTKTKTLCPMNDQDTTAVAKTHDHKQPQQKDQKQLRKPHGARHDVALFSRNNGDILHEEEEDEREVVEEKKDDDQQHKHQYLARGVFVFSRNNDDLLGDDDDNEEDGHGEAKEEEKDNGYNYFCEEQCGFSSGKSLGSDNSSPECDSQSPFSPRTNTGYSPASQVYLPSPQLSSSSSSNHSDYPSSSKELDESTDSPLVDDTGNQRAKLADTRTDSNENEHSDESPSPMSKTPNAKSDPKIFLHGRSFNATYKSYLPAAAAAKSARVVYAAVRLPQDGDTKETSPGSAADQSMPVAATAPPEKTGATFGPNAMATKKYKHTDTAQANFGACREKANDLMGKSIVQITNQDRRKRKRGHNEKGAPSAGNNADAPKPIKEQASVRFGDIAANTTLAAAINNHNNLHHPGVDLSLERVIDAFCDDVQASFQSSVAVLRNNMKLALSIPEPVIPVQGSAPRTKNVAAVASVVTHGTSNLVPGRHNTRRTHGLSYSHPHPLPAGATSRHGQPSLGPPYYGHGYDQPETFQKALAPQHPYGQHTGSNYASCMPNMPPVDPNSYPQMTPHAPYTTTSFNPYGPPPPAHWMQHNSTSVLPAGLYAQAASYAPSHFYGGNQNATYVSAAPQTVSRTQNATVSWAENNCEWTAIGGGANGGQKKYTMPKTTTPTDGGTEQRSL